MKTKTLLIAVLLFSTTLFAQNKDAEMKKAQPAKTTEEPKMTAEQEAAMKKEQDAWMEYMKPGPMHAMLGRLAGEWNEEVTFWPAPNAPAQNMKSSCSISSVMDGRYIEISSKGTMFGMPFLGKGLTGYDNALKVFKSTWYDNFGTGIMVLQGNYDEEGNAITMNGKGVDPMSGKEINIREVINMENENAWTVDMYSEKDGKEYKSMHIVYSKR